jgi:23S rRNA (guanosine2251-2'-O)-methyltransferase
MSKHHIYGYHAVNALFENPHRRIEKVMVVKDKQDKRMVKILEAANKRGIYVEHVTKESIDNTFPNANHQGVVAFATPAVQYSEKEIPDLLATCDKPLLILILDGVTDPHNLGACLRTADAAGVDFVIIPKDKNVGITPTVTKVACGAVEVIPIVRVTNLARVMKLLQNNGVWLYGAAGESAELIYSFDFSIDVAIVMGAEGKGLRRLTREYCDGHFALPMYGQVESLNVSVATAVSLYEVIRQRFNK